mmetsp:Transcript_26071/g.36418  ORF Transcript_26071/g.36418 Transcript_26071/m.36418 type:complete len:165 (-) Transcript_26071:537-1031(-)
MSTCQLRLRRQVEGGDGTKPITKLHKREEGPGVAELVGRKGTLPEAKLAPNTCRRRRRAGRGRTRASTVVHAGRRGTRQGAGCVPNVMTGKMEEIWRPLWRGRTHIQQQNLPTMTPQISNIVAPDYAQEEEWKKSRLQMMLLSLRLRRCKPEDEPTGVHHQKAS